MPFKSWAATDPGRMGAGNHDAWYANDEYGVYAVADGASAPAGEFAAQLVAQTIGENARELAAVAAAAATARDPSRGRREVFDQLQGLLERVNGDLHALVRDDANLKGAAATATVMLLAEEGIFLAHVGDTRAYVLRQGVLERLTEDHTMANDMVRSGKVSPDEVARFRFRNVVSRSLGPQPAVQVDVTYVDAQPGDLLLLCTDGLSDHTQEVDIVRVLREGGVMRPAARLCELANLGGGGDNVTAVVVALPPAREQSTVVAHLGAMQHSQRLDVLKHLFFCQHLTDDERAKVISYVHEQKAAAGQTIVRQNEPGSDLFLIVQGSLDVWVDGARVNTLGPGGHFGEIALVSGQARSATVVAREPVRLFRLGRDDFFDLSRRDQRVAVKMLWAFAQTLANRVTDLSKLVAQKKPGR